MNDPEHFPDWEKLRHENEVLRANLNRAREENHLLRVQHLEEKTKRQAFQKSWIYPLYKLAAKKPPPPGPLPHPGDSASQILTEAGYASALDGFHFIIDLPHAPAQGPTTPREGKTSRRLHWLIPDFGPGAGGHSTIFRILQCLERQDWEIHLWICGPTRYANGAQAEKCQREFFTPLSASIRLLTRENLSEVDGEGVVATDRWTAFWARAVGRVGKKFYFIQDWEPDFYAVGSEAFLSEWTYDFGFHSITAGPWLAEELQKRASQKNETPPSFFPLAVDHQIYQPAKESQEDAPGPRRIAFYGRLRTPRRCVEMGLLALTLLARQRDDFIVDLYGEETSSKWHCDFPVQHHGILDHHELANLYQKARLGLCLSGTNYSLVPLEMMACGLPVIDLQRPCTENVFPSETITLAEPQPEALARALNQLLDHPDEAREQANEALNHARTLNWEQSGDAVHQALVSVFETSGD